MVTLRPYQDAALREIVAAVKTQRDVLLQAATGAGKTILFSALIQAFEERYPKLRILVLAHREQLVRQAHEKLLAVWPAGADRIGLACAAVGRVELERPVLIGSPQTLANRLGQLPEIHMVIVDEAHRLPPKSKGGQYGRILDALRERYEKLRLLGVTATPYRLKHGNIYGQDCLHPEDNWFPELCWSIGIAELQEKGFLCPLDVLTAELPDLSKVAVAKTGDYDFGSLSETMQQDVHLDSAVKAFQKYAPERRHVVVFAVTIEHAEMLEKRFRAAGYSTGIVHSRMAQERRLEALAAFDRGDVQFIVNVGVLTEGWDSTAIDCIILCRPTRSPALYVQMVGRGLRTHPGKRDCLLLDLSGNYAQHGPVQEPKVTWAPPRPKVDAEEAAAGPTRCRKCRAEIPATAIVCPNCGEDVRRVLHDCPELVRPKIDTRAWPRPMAVVGRAKFTPSFWTNSGRHMFRIQLRCVDAAEQVYSVSAFLDIEGQAGVWSREKACRIWRALTHGSTTPRTLAEARARMAEISIPEAILVERSRNGKYYNVLRWYA